MVHIDPNIVTKIVHGTTSKVVEKSATVLKELEMIPKYLELATLKGSSRFNENEIQAIARHFEGFETELSRYDLVKNLLSIGVEKGKPLTSGEIGGFLDATSAMAPKEQENVLKFLKVAKEKEGAKVTHQSIRESLPYEKFKKDEIKANEGSNWLKRNPDWLSEPKLRERYEAALDNEYRIASNGYYKKASSALKNPPSEFVTSPINPEVVRAIGKCEDPVGFLNVIENLGVNRCVLYSADDLTKLLKSADGNPNMIRDLTSLFYPEEIHQITNVLLNDSKINLKDYNSIISRRFDYALGTRINIKYNRNKFLTQLGIKDKIKLSQLSLTEHLDVYSGSVLGTGRGKLIVGGNFEGGKRK